MPDDGTHGNDRRESRSATVAMATGGASLPEDDGPIQYEEGFKRVEKFNIISVSGAVFLR